MPQLWPKVSHHIPAPAGAAFSQTGDSGGGRREEGGEAGRSWAQEALGGHRMTQEGRTGDWGAEWALPRETSALLWGPQTQLLDHKFLSTLLSPRVSVFLPVKWVSQ